MFVTCVVSSQLTWQHHACAQGIFLYAWVLCMNVCCCVDAIQRCMCVSFTLHIHIHIFNVHVYTHTHTHTHGAVLICRGCSYSCSTTLQSCVVSEKERVSFLLSNFVPVSMAFPSIFQFFWSDFVLTQKKLICLFVSRICVCRILDVCIASVARVWKQHVCFLRLRCESCDCHWEVDAINVNTQHTGARTHARTHTHTRLSHEVNSTSRIKNVSWWPANDPSVECSTCLKY